ncbi:MAG TPA: RdgB/HAM1 family non-canonical purine NTP pyrophosphatase [Candidatus Thalassarchaeaceae archaeon]|jgi:XTP/dITP diphosphohydrolase|nr:RdgB/HAM1 family non-canonical purine NTP pyrophosphatase [Candidatus Thalassarchaeaceae archaeon]
MGETTTILFVTSNQGKIAEAKEALRPYGIDIESYNPIPEIDEIQSSDLVVVAADKLMKAASNSNLSSSILGVMVEDAGFFLDEYEGFPGVYSSYVHKTLGISGVLRSLKGIENRNASFRCVIGIHIDGENFFFEGTCNGIVSDEIRGKNGFGYDPIFIPNEGDGRTFAEMKLEEKEIFSHRAKALKAFVSFLEEWKQSPTSNHGNGS